MGVHKPNNFSRRDLFKIAALAAGSITGATNPLIGAAAGYALRNQTGLLGDFAKGATYGFGARVLAGCAPESTHTTPPNGILLISTPPPENKQYAIDSSFQPEAAFLSAATRYNPNVFSYIKDPVLRDTFASILLENQRSANGGFAARQAEAISDGRAIGVVYCGDSRVCRLGGVFPNVVDADGSKGLAIPVSRIGPTPAIFPEGINQSVFITHQLADCLPGGCGALGGVEALVNSDAGVSELIHHGVSQMTIDNIRLLIKMGAGSDAATAQTIEQAWAQTGARLQAEMNAYQYGGTHYTMYGVYGHADDSFQALGVVDNMGVTYPLEKFPLLNSYSVFANGKHEIIDALTKQSPTIITINGSRQFSSKDLLGDYANEPGVVFKSEANKIIGKPLSIDEARDIVSGGDYGVGALKNGKLLLLTADNAEDMATLRTMVMTEGIQNGSIKKFLEADGMIVEMIPDKTGRFIGTANIFTKESLAGDLDTLDILKAGKMQSTAFLADDVFSRQILSMASRDLELGVITEEQFAKISTTLEAIASSPITPIVKMGLQGVGDYFTFLAEANFVQDTWLGENFAWTAPGVIDKNVFWKNKTVLTSDPNLANMNGGPVDQYLRLGQLDHINVNQDDLVKAFIGSNMGYMSMGPTSNNPSKPWSEMKFQDVGKLMTLSVRHPNVYDAETKLITTLVLKPNRHTNEPGQYRDDDPNQLMMLEDQLTGIRIFGDVDYGEAKNLVAAYDQNNPNIRYLFEVSSVPQERRFEFRFVGILPVDNSTSQNDSHQKNVVADGLIHQLFGANVKIT